MRQLDLFLSVSSVVIAFFILSFWADEQARWTVLAFGMMSYGSWIALNRMEKYGVTRGGSPLDYDEDLDRHGLVECLLTVLGMMLVSMFFTGIIGRTALYVPKVGKILSILEPGAASLLFNQVLNEALYQTFVVAAAEESMKVSAIIGLTLRFRNSANELLRSRSRDTAALIVISIWAFLHAMLAYKNVYMTLAAFTVGFILFYLLLRRKSLLAAIISHSSYNVIIRIIQTLG